MPLCLCVPFYFRKPILFYYNLPDSGDYSIDFEYNDGVIIPTMKLDPIVDLFGGGSDNLTKPIG